MDFGGETLYLKHRGERFARVPEITCNPDDIDYESKALSLFGHSSPGFFPEILQHDKERHYLVLTDVLGNGQTLEQILILGEPNPIMINRLGNALHCVHAASEHITEAVRPDDDSEYYTRVLGHRFGFEENPGLNSVTEELALIPERNLILGDASPKNIGVNYDPDSAEYSFSFFDLETAHKGNHVFDYAYLLGHLLLHTAPDRDIASKIVESFEGGYGENSFSPALVKRICLGIMLYRLKGAIPYDTGHTDEINIVLEKNVRKLLDTDLSGISWTEMCEELSTSL